MEYKRAKAITRLRQPKLLRNIKIIFRKNMGVNYTHRALRPTPLPVRYVACPRRGWYAGSLGSSTRMNISASSPRSNPIAVASRTPTTSSTSTRPAVSSITPPHHTRLKKATSSTGSEMVLYHLKSMVVMGPLVEAFGRSDETTVYLLNKGPLWSLNGVMPYEAWHRKKPNVHVHCLGAFGSLDVSPIVRDRLLLLLNHSQVWLI